jgi:hypothetical protein
VSLFINLNILKLLLVREGRVVNTLSGKLIGSEGDNFVDNDDDSVVDGVCDVTVTLSELFDILVSVCWEESLVAD